MEIQVGVCPILSAFKTAISAVTKNESDLAIFEACSPMLDYTLDSRSVESKRAAYLAGEVYRIAHAQDCFAATAAAEIALTEINYRKNAAQSVDALSEAIWYLSMGTESAEWLPEVVGVLFSASAIRSKIFSA
jgi:hypothetical protein